VVFQTGMVGYQETMSDPSYAGQLLIFTYPLVGNYGAGPAMQQSAAVQARGVIVHRLMASHGHRDTGDDLDGWLRAQGVPVLSGVDTRMLTRLVRTHGVIPGALAVGPAGSLPPVVELQARAIAFDYSAEDFVTACATSELIWYEPAQADGPRIALIDYGAKTSMIDHLRARGAGVWVVPPSWTAEQILSLQPDGILLSNGPGDPAHLSGAVDTVRGLMAAHGGPIFGICLGHQLLARAAGGQTTKMRFGHRGVNQPVLETGTGRVVVTTQNHGYMVDPAGLPEEFTVTHINLNDDTVEGIAHRTRPWWGVQWHPEAHPGPTDSDGQWDRFLAAAASMRNAAFVF
jgi:carbamoyl-phosphate synthase small subunit